MMGQKTAQPKLYVSFPLDGTIPPNHLVRRLANVLDFGFVRGLTRRFYSHTGSAQWTPWSSSSCLSCAISLTSPVSGDFAKKRAEPGLEMVPRLRAGLAARSWNACDLAQAPGLGAATLTAALQGRSCRFGPYRRPRWPSLVRQPFRKR
jgi:hypothetical protein